MLSKTKVKKELDATEAALSKLRETIKRCEDGILVNVLVADAFRAELEK